MRYFVRIDGESFEVEVLERLGHPPVARLVQADPDAPEIRVLGSDLGRIDDHEWTLRTETGTAEIFCGDVDKSHPITIRGLPGERVIRKVIQVESARDRAFKSTGKEQKRAGEGQVRSPMPGKVTKLVARVGERVRAGTPVAIVEAMKMENELVAGTDGVISAVHVEAGQPVEAGTLLVEIRADGT